MASFFMYFARNIISRIGSFIMFHRGIVVEILNINARIAGSIVAGELCYRCRNSDLGYIRKAVKGVCGYGGYGICHPIFGRL